MSDTPDFSEFQDDASPAVAGSNELAMLSQLADDQRQAELELAMAEEATAAAKETLAAIAEHRLPELMEQLGMASFTTQSGLSITISEKLRATLPKVRNEQGVEWLEENGHGGSVKRTFVIRFNKGDEAWARKFQRDLNQRKKPVDSVIEQKVEPSTLRALLRRDLEAGVDVPDDIFSIHRQKVSSVKST
tara:strand:+ start:3547 stop:4116 length:570 start_codon:yes stop_codon:yes gene_type:complete